MAYSDTLATPVDRIRFAVQDTDDAAPLLTENTYAALYDLYDDSEPRATVAAAEALIAKFAREPDTVEITGAVKVAWKYRLDAWRELANGLRAELGLAVVGATDTTLRVGYLTRATGSGDEFAGG